MTKLRIWSLFLLLLGICSCVDQISFPLEKADTERLIVSGLITDGKGTKRIYLSTTTAANPIRASTAGSSVVCKSLTDSCTVSAPSDSIHCM